MECILQFKKGGLSVLEIELKMHKIHKQMECVILVRDMTQIQPILYLDIKHRSLVYFK